MRLKFLFTAVLFFNHACYSQKFYNLNFEQKCDSSKTGLCYWDLSWGGKKSVMPGVTGNNQCLLITGKSEASVVFAEQTALIVKTKQLQIIEVSAKISTQNVAGKGAGLNIGVYDTQNNLLVTKDMGYASLSWVKGTSGWKKYSLTTTCPAGAAKIKLGAILYGEGQARFDDYTVKIMPVAGRVPSKLAIKYISAACDSIAKHSLVKDSINIQALKKTALRIAGPAKTYSDCYLAVEYLLASLRPYGDHHSFFMKADEVKKWKTDTSGSTGIQYAQSKIMDSCGYIFVPPFHGGNKKLMQAYADTLHQILKRANNAGIKGWIIDLRENTGGNMTPMIAGLGPLFDSEKLGSLVDVNGKKESWYYRSGSYYSDNEKIMSATDPTTLSSHLPVAVLISARTGSSGEAVLISFIGNSKTKIFGMPSWGLTTGNGGFDLPDGARMMMASTIMADRHGKMYHGRIEPDVFVEENEKTKIDTAIKMAVAWILKQ